jgi:hypothetical protein
MYTHIKKLSCGSKMILGQFPDPPRKTIKSWWVKKTVNYLAHAQQWATGRKPTEEEGRSSGRREGTLLPLDRCDQYLYLYCMYIFTLYYIYIGGLEGLDVFFSLSLLMEADQPSQGWTIQD